MKYTDLSPEEININITEQIADLMVCIAHANSDFVCMECLRTLDKLKSILGCLDSGVAVKVQNEVSIILE